MCKHEVHIREDQERKALEEELETERAINFFAISLIDQTTIDEVMWDVAKNCIARLNFVDCVVYWLEEERDVLVQKAAHGPKNIQSREIFHPIEIPVGRGIVGTVAKTGVAEIIADTSRDERYIVDDEIRYSEITVPIVSEGRVLGVIDAEHPERDFFRPRHLHILTSIASLCAQKIRRVQIEQAYQQTERQLLENNKRIAETKLVALRMQMNPHFVFNSLNSINNFILQNEVEQASAYLTKFSRLMRQVLVNTQTEWVSLRNELKALSIYIELEQLRCENPFESVLTVDPALNQDMVHVPPLLLHPYVENAIRHGLVHQKVGTPVLEICCEREGDFLVIRITDNGIGREASVRYQTNGLTAHKSHGSRITHERLQIVNKIYGVDAHIDVTDLVDPSGAPAGTCVMFTMKLKQP
ncbi:histidine kinase [Larkinella soli]|uniref:histidine kinase n=1 Tax=Larkinella soli TaxID=1770527 RepID=UPI000FFB37DC|nr:histidine kinase [Larkinella soli]